MVRVDDVYNLVRFVTNKDLSGNTMNVEEFNDLAKMVNLDIFKEKYGLPEEYQFGQPLPRRSYEVTKKIIDDMRHLKVRTGVDVSPLSIDQWGRAVIPTNYLHLSSATYNYVTTNECTEKNVIPKDIELLPDGQIADRTGNSITIPTLKNPCMAIFNNYFQFYPPRIRQVELTYLRHPNEPVYASTIDAFDNEVFNEAGSVHFEYPIDMLSDIVKKILSYVNVPLKENDVVQYAEMKDKQGN